MDLYDRLVFEDYAARRHCYARAERLRESISSAAVLDAIIKHLNVPRGGVSLPKLSVQAKQAAIVDHARYLSRTRTSHWHEMRPADIVAAAIAASKLAAKEKDWIFPKVKKESDLLAPVVGWLRERSESVHEEVPMGTKRADVVGYTPVNGWKLQFEPKIITVELKNQLQQLAQGLDQMTSYKECSTAVYLACTPRLAVDYLKKHATSRGVRRWEADALERKLAPFGIGLLLVEGEEVVEVHQAKASDINSKQFERVRAHFGE